MALKALLLLLTSAAAPRSRHSAAGADPLQLGGHVDTRGGHVAAATGICNGFEDPADRNRETSSKPNALLLFNPVYDNGPDGYGHSRIKEHFPAISPAHNITPDDPPTLVFLGSNDELIPVSVAEKFDADLKKAGITSSLHIYKGEPHGFFNEGKSQRCCVDTILKMDQFLGGLGWLEGEPHRAALRGLLSDKPTTPNIPNKATTPNTKHTTNTTYGTSPYTLHPTHHTPHPTPNPPHPPPRPPTTTPPHNPPPVL